MKESKSGMRDPKQVMADKARAVQDKMKVSNKALKKTLGGDKETKKETKVEGKGAEKKEAYDKKYMTGRVGKDMYGKPKAVPDLKKLRADKIITSLD
jgi:hypothetical protein